MKPAKNLISGLTILALFRDHSAIFLGYTGKGVFGNGSANRNLNLYLLTSGNQILSPEIRLFAGSTVNFVSKKFAVRTFWLIALEGKKI